MIIYALVEIFRISNKIDEDGIYRTYGGVADAEREWPYTGASLPRSSVMAIVPNHGWKLLT